ncbi:unnamed protein product [Mytilus coruscus]|uniref:Uncharacterized protein n=1 Tax=Mytilus coruscus TaxID=42192 RepID=A0A6J8E6W6_MYTCO|nr:unnamed protein product [Mytilus coruscus]
MLKHVAEVFGEPTGSPRASLAPIRVAALQAQAWMLVGGDLEDLVAHINRLAITRPHIIGQAVQGQMEEVCLEGGRPVPPYFSTAPVNSPGALIDWRVQAAIMGELGDKAEAFRGMFRLQGPRAATGSPAIQLGQAEGGIDPLRSPSDSPPGKKILVETQGAAGDPTPPAFDSHFHFGPGGHGHLHGHCGNPLEDPMGNGHRSSPQKGPSAGRQFIRQDGTAGGVAGGEGNRRSWTGPKPAGPTSSEASNHIKVGPKPMQREARGSPHSSR